MTSHYHDSKISGSQSNFLDRDDRSRRRTMEAKYGLPSTVFFFSAIFEGPRFVKIQEFCNHGNMT